MKISVVDRSGRVHEAELRRAIAAINRQLAEHFEPAWKFGAQLHLHEESAAERHATPLSIGTLPGRHGDAVIYLTDRANIAGAEGYHARNGGDVPFGFVFVDICEEQGDAWTVALSHEAIELLGDPMSNLLVQGPSPHDRSELVFHSFELCDPVTDETYLIDDVAVANFVLPGFFVHGHTADHARRPEGARNDHKGRPTPGEILEPFGTAPGGYLSYYDPRRADDHKWTTWTAPGDAVAVQRVAARKALSQARVERRKAAKVPSGPKG